MSDQLKDEYLSDVGEYDLDGKMLKPTIVKCDIPIEMRDRAIELAFEAMNKYSVERDISDHIKTAFDKELQPVWQCVVGIYYIRNII
jgi:dynein light chain LC8-type